jgi:hypothetical protein
MARVGFGWAGFGERYAKDMRNGVISIPPHEFKQPSSSYFRVLEFEKHYFGVAPYGITAIQNSMIFRPAILSLSYSFYRTSIVRGVDWVAFGSVGLCWVRLVMRMRNGIIISPHDFKHPSRWFYDV